jgi:hypothetical protein
MEDLELMNDKTIGAELNYYKKVALMGWPVFLPDNPIFEGPTLLNMNASVLSRMMGVSHKTALGYIKDLPPPVRPSEYIPIDEAKNYCNKILLRIYEELKETKPSEDLQKDLIRNAFGRLLASQELAVFTSCEGYNFETKLIGRLILENLNFIFQVSNVQNNKETFIGDFCSKHKIKNTNINDLKRFVPFIDIGKLYGLLTAYAHFDPNVQNTMFTWGEKEMNIYLKSQHYSYENFLILILLIELAEIIFEYAFRHERTKFILLDKKDFSIKPRYKKIRYSKIRQLYKLSSQQAHSKINPDYSISEIIKFN